MFQSSKKKNNKKKHTLVGSMMYLEAFMFLSSHVAGGIYVIRCTQSSAMTLGVRGDWFLNIFVFDY